MTTIFIKMQTMAMMNTSSLQQRIASPMQKPMAVRPAPLRLRSVVVRAEAPKEIQVCDLLASVLVGGCMASCDGGVRQVSDKVSWPTDNQPVHSNVATSPFAGALLCFASCTIMHQT